ncbi:MAG TPA: tyrosine-protein phosphatase [Bdellovibrionota bacterium]|jgi:protein tyrosine/serine phosphatase
MQGRIFRYAFVLILALSISPSVVFADRGGHEPTNPSQPIPKFLPVEEGLYRGGRPGREGVTYLKNLGIRTIVSLDNNTSENEDERRFAESLGMKVILLPINPMWTINDQTVNSALEAVRNPQLRPLFLHCKHGEDRTGMLVGLFKAENRGWTAAAAYKEALDLGFHRELFPLDRYFRDRLRL